MEEICYKLTDERGEREGMHIESLKVFCDLIDTRSFSKAASKNFVSQSAVSQQVRALEERFDRKFVERTRNGIVPTAAGLVFYQGCREIIQRYNSLNEEVKNLGETVSGQVRLETIYSVGLHELSPHITRFIKNYPQVNIHIEYSRPNKIYEDASNGLIDLGIVAYPASRPQIEIIPFRSDKLVLVCSPRHVLSSRRRIEVECLKGESFIGFERDIPTRKAVDKILREHGVQARYAMEFDNIETIKRSIEADLGVAILPRATVENEVRAGTLKAISFTKSFTRPIALIHRKGRELSAAAQRFVEILTENNRSEEARGSKGVRE
jgi:DNA-binding transcriptional LysR family regulator